VRLSPGDSWRGTYRNDDALNGRIKHFFDNPAPLSRNAVFGYRSPKPKDRDDRGRGLLRPPWPTKADKAAKAEYDKPMFDRAGGMCRADGKPETSVPVWSDENPLTRSVKVRTGSYSSATWEHADLGNVSAAVTARIGESKTYEELVLGAQSKVKIFEASCLGAADRRRKADRSRLARRPQGLR
jgi:hypothetical protein